MVEIFKIHGCPKSIVSDRDPLFVSSFWRELFRAQGTTLAFSSAYHPQSNGQSEVLNRCLEAYLRCFVSDHPRAWYQYLHLAEYWHNTSFHTSIDTNPFHTLYGRSPPTPMDVLRGPSSTTVQLLLQEHREILQEVKLHLSRARQRMKLFTDQHRRDITFQPGDWVLLKLQPYRQTSLSRRTSQKLAKQYYGPFRVHRRFGLVAYELLLPETARIHPVFHVSLLRPYKGADPIHYFRPLPPTPDQLRPATPLTLSSFRTNSEEAPHLTHSNVVACFDEVGTTSFAPTRAHVIKKSINANVPLSTASSQPSTQNTNASHVSTSASIRDFISMPNDIEDNVKGDRAGIDTGGRPKRITTRPFKFKDYTF
uniref:Retrotransposable element Tf2 n=1 Tax=Cajanus cajan TaxID=3821 RepID=A0A151U0Q2_CAJCA|nr:Retrotransposable element Tf2 [Cajanus cajan]